MYTISLIKLEIGSDTGSGVDSSNPILAAEAKAKVDAHARVAATLANKGEDGDAEENRVRSVVPKRVSFDASKDAKSAADPQSSKQQRDSFVIGGVRVGGIVVGGIMVDDDGGIITPADGLEGLAGTVPLLFRDHVSAVGGNLLFEVFETLCLSWLDRR